MINRFRALLLTPLIFIMSTASAWAEPLVLEVTEAKASVEASFREPVLTITLTAAGREAFARFTSENVGRKAEIRIDGKTVMRPVIREPILGGKLQISGIAADEAFALARRLSAGNAKLEVEVAVD